MDPLVGNLMESIMLPLVTFLVHSLTLFEACTLCLLFVSVLVIMRGVKSPIQTGSEEQRAVEPVDCRHHAASSTGVQSSKFYAVAQGVTPGIYRSWEECAPMVIGVRGAIYKSFPTRDRAESFLRRFS